MNIHETECTITHEGRTFTANGTHVTDTHIFAYLHEPDANPGYIRNAKGSPRMRSGDVTTWHGEKIGRYTMHSARKQLGTWIYYTTIVTNDGARYHGTSQGPGMCVRGKRVAADLRKANSK